MGLKPPEDDTAFLVLGRINADSVIDTHLTGVMLLAWRCLYAEITRVRIYKENPDIGAALVRTGAMCITRVVKTDL